MGCIGLFPAINGYRLTADQLGAVQTIRAVASGKLNEQGLAVWIRANMAATC
jgi:prophage maintenance system killer protein